MRKIIIYIFFGIAAAIVIYTFLTAKNYAQLATASVLYIPLAYFAYLLFQKMSTAGGAATMGGIGLNMSAATPPPAKPVQSSEMVEAQVVDVDKRTFLKLIGAIGLTFFVSTIFGRRAESLLFQDTTPQPTTSNVDPEGLPAEGYRISEIDENENSYYGFTNKAGHWFIMKEEPDAGSFRYARGKSDFPGSWNKRGELKYDYYYNTF